MNLKRHTILLLLNLVIFYNCFGQFFIRFPIDSMGVTPYELYTTIEGVTHLTSSFGEWRIRGRHIDGPSIGTGVMYDDKGKPIHQSIKMRNYTAEDSIRGMAQGPDSIFYFVAHDNFFLFRPDGKVGGWGWPPFNFPKTSNISKIWIDSESDLFAGTVADNFFIIKNGGKKNSWFGVKAEGDKDSNYIVTEGGLNIKQVVLAAGAGVFSFAQDAQYKNIIWIGTNRGLFTWDKINGKVNPVNLSIDGNITITEIYTGENGHIWFSTMEKGMGVYSPSYKNSQFYPYPKSKVTATTKFPIKTFCYKSPGQFFVAVMDSLPAIFNTQSRNYLFFNDSVLNQTPNRTTDIKVDKLGHIMMIKGGSFYIAEGSKNEILNTSIVKDSSLLAPFFSSVRTFGGEELASLDFQPELLKKIVLKYNQNSFWVYYDLNDFSERKEVKFGWRVAGYTNGWVETFQTSSDSLYFVPFDHLKPGKYLLQLKVKVGKEDWRKQIAEMEIIITSPFWQTWWFWASVITTILLLIYLIVKLRVRSVRKYERQRAKHEKELLELEARALRSQMNPHFIFNCLNSIKSLIQEHKEEKSINYLTTFSKLIRTLLNNADKKEISLFDEIETCKLYLQLEAMRFDTKFSYAVNVDDNIDLKSVQVPALIIQPFIENAIWHGIVPKGEGGHVELSVLQKGNAVEISIDDNGIGREASRQNKPVSGLTHNSKGVNLTQSRLELDNLLRQRKAKLEMIDKKDENGVATGTKIIITINEEI